MILITGGAGYIGTHTLVELSAAGYDFAVIDNFSNSKPQAIRRVEQITGKRVRLYRANVRDEAALDRVFTENPIDCVIHFAGYKAVGESAQKPLAYYENNIGSTVALCKAMCRHGCLKIVFSSSATVYGVTETMPLTEDMPLGAINPYGRTKLFIEHILRDLSASDPRWCVALLRYFNPIGAHESGLIGEDPKGIPNNLMPYITQVAVGRLEKLHIFGKDYPTADGTGVRDYIHVVDLAKGHVRAVEWAMNHTGCEAFNLGTGHGCSVLELKSAFERTTGVAVPYQIDPRRPGDPAEVYANADKARDVLHWHAEKTVDDMCRDAWRWQKNNPSGFPDGE